MDKLYFNHPGGFPLETKTLEEMQETWGLLKEMAKGFGSNVIISGCEQDYRNDAVTYVQNGIITLNDEILPFRGGLMSSEINNVKVYETHEFVNLESGDPVLFRKKRIAGLGHKGVPFSSFVRIAKIAQIHNLVKDLEDKKVDKEEGKELSDNNLSDELKEQLQIAYENTPKLHLFINANGSVAENKGIIKNINVSHFEIGGYNIALSDNSGIPATSVVLVKADGVEATYIYDFIPFSTLQVHTNGVDAPFRLIAWW